jgi:hypothetical protein
MDLDILDDCDTVLQKTFEKALIPNGTFSAAASNTPVHNGTFSAAASNTAVHHNGTFSAAGRPDTAVANDTFSTGRPDTGVANETFSAGSRPHHPAGDVTFDKGSAAAGSSSDLLNATYATKPEHGEGTGIFSSDQPALNATFDAGRGACDENVGFVKRSPPQTAAAAGLNSTFSRSNSSGGGGRTSNGQRKMSEDRLSSASSG